MSLSNVQDVFQQLSKSLLLHITKNCQTQSSLSRDENHAEEIKNYYDGSEILD